MLLSDGQEVPDQKNHPLAIWMLVVASINQNIALATLWGSFSVLLGAVEKRLGIGRELSTLALPAVSLACAICSPFIGISVARVSLRLLMIAGSALGVAGFVLLALVPSYPAYLIAYGVLLGPGLGLGMILPGTLVTRWYSQGRGRALGILNTPIVIAIIPLLSTYMLRAHGLPVTYAVLAALSAASLVVNFFAIDRPPGSGAASAVEAQGAHGTIATDGMGIPQLIRKSRFWVLTFGFSAASTAAIIFAGHTVPMAQSWGMTAASGASLVTITFLAGIPGALLFGWIGDRLGGVLTLGILVLDLCLLFGVLLLHPPFILLAVTFGLVGLHGSATMPVISLARSESFGKESFSRAFGLLSLLILPITVLAAPAAAMVFTHTDSYAGAIAGEGAFLAAAAILAFTTVRGRPVIPVGV